MRCDAGSVDHDRPSWFAWLVCLEMSELAFAVTDPLVFYPDYAPKAHLSDLRAVEASGEDDLEILVITNLTGKGSFLNLAAPLLVNPNRRRVVQAILADGAWPLWAPLDPTPQPIGPSRGAAQIESNPHR